MIPDRRRALLAVLRAAARSAEAARAVEPVAAPPDLRGGRALGALAHGGLYLAALAAVVAFFSPAFGHGSTAESVRLAIGAVLACEGMLVAGNPRGARRRLLRRLYARAQRRGTPARSLAETLRWRLAEPLLVALALSGLIVGLVLAAQAAAALA